MRKVLGELDDERRHVLCKCVFVSGIVGEQHPLYAGDLGGGLGDRTAILARYEYVDVLTGDLCSRRDSVQRRRPQRDIIVFGDDEGGHQITRASVLSLSTSSATEPTLTPASRFDGSSTFSTTRRGVTSTPSASGVVIAIGFFFARMMLGSEA